MLRVGLPAPILVCWAARVDSIRRAPSAIYTGCPVMLPSPVFRLRHDACTRYGGVRRRSSAVQPGPHLSTRKATKQWATAVQPASAAAACLRPPAARNPGPGRCRRRFLLLARINSGLSPLSHTQPTFPFNSSATTTSQSQSQPEEESDGGRKKLAVRNHQHRISQRPDQRRSEPSLPECW